MALNSVRVASSLGRSESYATDISQSPRTRPLAKNATRPSLWYSSHGASSGSGSRCWLTTW